MSITELTAALGVQTSEPDESGWDRPLFVTTCMLCGFGLLMILSASYAGADHDYGDPSHYFIRQVIGIGIGAVGATVILVAPWRLLRRAVWPAYFITILLGFAVLSPLGHSVNGASRWLSLGPMNFQPSELAKLAVILAVAHFLACNEGRLKDVAGVALPAAGLAFPFLLLMKYQKDFGTMVILTGLTGVLLFVAGLQKRWLVGAVAMVIPVAVHQISAQAYRLRRLEAYWDPFKHAEDAGYQVVQAMVALATGGAIGTGLASGVGQSGFIPEPHTDFISAVIGEELGAFGWCLTVGLQMVLVWRILVVSERARDLFGSLVAVGVATMLGAQAVINLGVVSGLIPNKGLVLPFLSYGASAVIVQVIAVGIVLRVGLESRREVS